MKFNFYKPMEKFLYILAFYMRNVCKVKNIFRTLYLTCIFLSIVGVISCVIVIIIYAIVDVYAVQLSEWLIQYFSAKILKAFNWTTDITCSVWGEVNRFCEQVLFYIKKSLGFNPSWDRSAPTQPLELQPPPEINFDEIQDEADIEAMEPGVMEEITDDEGEDGDGDDTGPNKAFYGLLIGTSLLVVVVVFGVAVVPALVAV